MNIIEETTRFVFRDYTSNELSILQKLLSADDQRFLYEDTDFVACPIGVENYIKRKFPHATIESHNPWASAKMKHIPQETPPPRNRLQKDALKFLRQYKDRPQIGLITNVGSGKAQPYSVTIPTPNGYRSFGSLSIGDTVFARDGSQSTIVGIFEQGLQDVYQITFSDGRTARCTLDHLWEVHENHNGRWVKNVMSTGSILNSYQRVKQYIPLNNPVQYKKSSEPKIDPYVYGVYTTKLKATTLDGMLDHPEYELDVSKDVIDKMIASGGIHVKYHEKCKKYVLGKNSISDSLKPSVMLSTLVEQYLHGPISTRVHFMMGVFDAIGDVVTINGYHYPVYNVGSLSKSIQKIILDMIYSLGFRAMMKNNLITVYIPKNDDLSEHMLQIVDVKKLPSREACRCIMIDHPEHLYLTENFIVTHNTYMAIKHAITCGEKTLIICPTTSILEQWVDSLKNMFKIPENRILHVSSTSKLQQMTGDYDWVLVLEQTLQTLVRQKALEPLLQKCRFGMKIIDEIHMFLRNNIAIDCCSNIKRSVYLTGTFFRTKEEESNLFNAVYHGILRFEVVDQEDIERYGQPKHIELYSVLINSKLTRREVSHIIIKAKISNRKSVQVVSIGRYMDIVCPGDGRVTEYMKQSLAVIKRMRERVNYGRMLVLVPSINATKKFRKLIADMYPNLKVGCINSDQPRALNTRVKQEADIVVSTSKSSGVGFDMKDLSILIAIEQFRSPVLVEQISGRLRPRPDKKSTYYVDIADKALGSYLLRWRDERLSKLKVKAKSYTQFKVSGDK